MKNNTYAYNKRSPNSKCKCGSGKKFKKCCGLSPNEEPQEPIVEEQEEVSEERRVKSRAAWEMMRAWTAPIEPRNYSGLLVEDKPKKKYRKT